MRQRTRANYVRRLHSIGLALVLMLSQAWMTSTAAAHCGCQGCVTSSVGAGCSCGPCEGSTVVPAPVVQAPGATSTTPAPSLTSPTMDAPQLAFSEQSAAFGGRRVSMPGSVGGYIDDATIRTRVRFRYDNAANLSGAGDADRAEYIYPHIGAIGGRGPELLGSGGLIGDIDLNEYRTYIEYAFTCNFSAFIDVPIRDISSVATNDRPFVGNNGRRTVSGFGDLSAGVRLGLINCEDTKLTGQIRVFAPTGDEFQGLGVGHSSIEFGLLYQEQLTDSWVVFGEVLDWINLDPTEFTGGTPFDGEDADSNILRYGLGTGYDLWRDCSCQEHRLIAVFEVVAWTALDGYALNNGQLVDATGDTIVNGKYGLRYNRGANTIYAGYGHAWTDVGSRWYSDLFRLEIGRNF